MKIKILRMDLYIVNNKRDIAAQYNNLYIMYTKCNEIHDIH